MTVQIALYKGPPTTSDIPHFVSHYAIKVRTISPYSHGELVIDGVGYSASARDKGVRRKEINFNSGKWDMFDINPSRVNIPHAMEIFKKYEGSEYDWRNIVRYVIPFAGQEEDKFVCFEFIGVMLNFAGSYKLTGNDLKEWALQNRP